jgi:hypothetical protein
MTPTPTTSTLQPQIDQLGVDMRAGFDELKNMITGIGERMRRLELNEAGCQPIINQRLDAAWKEIDQLKSAGSEREARLTRMEERVNFITRAALFVGGPAVTAVVGMLLAIFSGQLHLGP